MDPLTNMITEALKRLLEDGWEPPFFFTSISANGSFLCGRYDDDGQGGLEATTVAEHFEDDAFILPINMMMTNDQGEAVRLSIQKPGEPIVYH
jgi:hypothetical protein